MPRIGKNEELKTEKEKKTVSGQNEENKKAEKGKAKATKTTAKKTVATKTKTVKSETLKKASESKKKTVAKEKIVAKVEKEEKPKVAKTKIKKTVEPKKKTVSKEKVIAKSTKKATKDSLKKNVAEKKEKLTKVIKPKKKISKIEEKKKFLPEYYDLPYRYNDTIIKVLYQTPKRLFVYWDISDKDRELYLKAFGEDFFEKTYPVLLVHNEELNYTFEVQINDFANSWYLDINDTKSKYIVQLGRKFREIKNAQINLEVVKEANINLQNDFVYITDSNKLETPNDRVLFDKIPEKIVFRNVKTGEEEVKEIKQVLRKLPKSYENPKVEDLYKELYGEEWINEEEFISNPSSGLSSSFFK